MRLKSLVLLLAVGPLLLALVAMSWVVSERFGTLAGIEKQAVADLLDQARRDELQHLVRSALRTLKSRYPEGPADARSRVQALAYLRNLSAADDYFFVYDIDGRCLLDAGDPARENRAAMDLLDVRGVPVVQRLIGQALGGGGTLDHQWVRPTTGKSEHKLSYAESVPGWSWIVGTGMYHDSRRQAEAAIGRSSAEALLATRDSILWIGLSALVAVAAGGMALNVHELRKANAKLRQMHQRAERAAQATREAVARDLHDGVQQSLGACKLMLDAAAVSMERGQGPGELRLDQVSGGMVDAMREIRRIAHGLASMTLRDLGLKAAIEEMARKQAEHMTQALDVAVDELPQLPLEVAHDLLQVARQAIVNAQAHAKATRIELKLAHEAERGLTLQVSDNGTGFDVAAVLRRPREGLGLTSMRERIEMLGGRFMIRSASGAGATVISAFVPRAVYLLPPDAATNR